MTDIREAASRLRRIAAGEPAQGIYKMNLQYSLTEHEADLYAVSNAMLPLLDDSPITEEWLRPLCQYVSESGTFWQVRVDVHLIRWSGGWHLKCGDVSVTETANRGDVLRLLFALGEMP